jgi:hypothetical protein
LSLQYRRSDSLIGATATEISAHAFTHALGIVAGLTLLDQTDRTHDLARGTEPALQAIVSKKRHLQRMKPIAACHTFDREDVSAAVTDRKRKARIDPSSLDDDRASAALPPVAALLRSGQMKVFAQKIQERESRVIELDRSLYAVHSQSR